MKIVLFTFLLVVFTQTTYSVPNKYIKHSHNGRTHTHPLPKTGLNHSHNKGKKKAFKNKKYRPLTEKQKISNAIINYKAYISGRKKITSFSQEEKKYMLKVSSYYASQRQSSKPRKPNNSIPINSNVTCSIASGAKIIAQDSKNTYLGKVASSYDSDSIFNEYGTYGSEYNSNSIWNEYGTFGSEYNNYSPFNTYTNSPPMLVKNGEIVGYLSANKYMSNTISPNLLKALCKDEL